MRLISSLLLILLTVTAASAQLFTGRLTTSYLGWQGRNAAGDKVMYARGYENAQFDLSGKDISFTTSFQFSNDWGSTVATDPDMRFSSLALKVRNLFDVAHVTLGRQFIAGGVGVGLLDGISAGVKLYENRLAVTAYGGYNVVESRVIDLKKNLSDNCFYGGFVRFTPMDETSLRVSYMNKSRKPEPFHITKYDSVMNPTDVVISLEPVEEQLASADVDLQPLKQLTLSARGDYDVDRERIVRGQAEARFTVLPALDVTGEYLWRQPRVAYNSIFAVFSSTSLQEIEGGVEYEFSPLFKTYARFATVSYTDENSQRLVVGGMYDVVSFSYTQHFGYAGDLSGVTVQASLPMQENTIIPSLGLGYANYKLSKDNASEDMFYANAGATYRPSRALSASATVQWLKNTLYSNDVRVFLTVNYWFSNRLNLF